MPAVPRPGPVDPRTEMEQLLAQNPNAQLPEGFHARVLPNMVRTQQGPVNLGTRVAPVRDPTWNDYISRYAPAVIAALGSYGLATGPALAGQSAVTIAGANAGLNAGMTAAQGGGVKDVLLAGATGGLGGGAAGGSMSWADILKQVATDPNTYAAIGSIAGNASGAKSDQRMQETANTNAFNNAETARYQTEQAAQNQAGQLDLQRKMFSEDARAGRGKQAALADLLSNLQDISINVPGIQTANVTGGLRPSAMGATGRQGMAELSKQALAALMSGDTFTGGEILNPNPLTAMPKAGGTEQVLDWVGLLASLGGGIGKNLENVQKPITNTALPNQPGAVIGNQRNVRF